MLITTEYPLQFYPEGSILLDGPEKYRSILKDQNKYLFNLTTFPIHDTNEEQMTLIALPDLLKHIIK